MFLIPKIANHQGQSDVAVEYVKFDPANPEQMEGFEKLTAIIRPTVSQVVNAGRLKAGDVCRKIQPVVKQICGQSACFAASYHHAKACEFYKVRPKKGEPNPEKTKLEYCQYDDAHKDYVFTNQWVDFLTHELKRPGRYDQIMNVGRTKKRAKALSSS